MNTINTIKPTPEMLEVLKRLKLIVDVEKPIINAILSNRPFTIKQVEDLFDFYINGLTLNLNANHLQEIKLYWLIKNTPEYKKYELNKILTN